MEQSIRILHLEDNVRDTEIIRDRLEADGLLCDITVAKDRLNFETALTAGPWDIILSDFNLPCYDGLSALKLARGAAPQTPVIMLSGSLNPEEAVECLQAGATDYLLKERIERLSSAVRHALHLVEERRQRQAAEADLARKDLDLRDFFENATISLHWVGLDGTILRVNQAEFDILGYAHEEYVRHNFAEFHEKQDAAADILRRLKNDEGLRNHEARLRCKDGSIRTVVIDSSTLWEDGQFIHTCCFTRDISERKEAEMALRARNVSG